MWGARGQFYHEVVRRSRKAQRTNRDEFCPPKSTFERQFVDRSQQSVDSGQLFGPQIVDRSQLSQHFGPEKLAVVDRLLTAVNNLSPES